LKGLPDVGVNTSGPSAFETPTPGWSGSARGRGELAGIALFCLASVLVPLLRTELYPFSRAPMFADAPQRYCNYRVSGPDGRELPLADFGLQRNYWGNPPGVGVGFHPPDSVDHFGEVADREAVTAHVAARLQDFPALEAVEVVQEVIGPVDGGRVGLVSSSRWRVANPHPGDSATR
jgi:hypothetical protein